jgi:hypothetical protein
VEPRFPCLLSCRVYYRLTEEISWTVFLDDAKKDMGSSFCFLALTLTC